MSRVQLALNVNDIDEAVSFYTALFGTGPAKRRPGYANFAVTEPPLKLVLLENPGQGGTLNHLGVEHRRPRRRTVGDLHRPGRQRHLLGSGRRTALGRRPSRTRQRTGRAGHPVLQRRAGR